MSSLRITLGTLLLLMLATAPAGEAPAPADGTWKGSAEGYEGPVEVEVTVAEGKITAVKVTAHKESAPGKALTEIPKRIVEKNSTEVDAVTGATISSKAIMGAAAAALKKAAEAPQRKPGTETK